MSSEQIDWGVPDWRDESAYPKPDQLTNTLWKWEFLRRDEGYRNDWLRWEKETREFYKVKDIPPPHDPLELYALMPNSKEKYGLSSLPNPANPKPQKLHFMLMEGYMFFGDFSNNGVREINLPETHVALVLDLTKPIEVQLEKAKKELLRIQMLQQGKHLREKEKTGWVNLLRELDGKAANETFEEIGRIIINRGDYGTNASNASARYKVALDMWRGINPHS